MQFIVRTPPWVWPVLALVLWLGWRDLRHRTIAPARLAILPAVATSMSLVTLGTAPAPLLSLLAWLPALALALPLGMHAATRRRIDVDATRRRLHLAGGWFSLALGLAIFSIRYAMGAVVGHDPALAAAPLWIVAAGALSGFTAGLSLGWLACLWRRYRRALRNVDFPTLAHRVTPT